MDKDKQRQTKDLFIKLNYEKCFYKTIFIGGDVDWTIAISMKTLN